MFDPKKLLDDLLSSQVPGATGTVRDKAGQAVQMAKDNPLAAGALAAVLLGTGAGRQVTGTAVKLGGLAAIGGLAYKAYQNYKAGQKPADVAREPELLPPPAGDSFDPAQAPQGEAEFALTIVRAMIAAAKADGRIDEAERGKIIDKVGLSGGGAPAPHARRAARAAAPEGGARAAAATPQAQKIELYTASRLAIDPDTRAERGYLDMLAGRLSLPDALVDHIEATVASAKAPVGVNPKW